MFAKKDELSFVKNGFVKFPQVRRARALLQPSRQAREMVAYSGGPYKELVYAHYRESSREKAIFGSLFAPVGLYLFC